MSLHSLKDVAPLLIGLQPDALEFLESVATEVEFEKGSVVFDEDERADTFYLVATGKVGLEVSFPARDSQLIETIGPGEILGVSWLFPPHRWNWTARSLARTRAVAFDAGAVRDQCEQDTDLALHVYRTVAEEAVKRLHATRFRLLDLYPGAEQ